jgi:uncharacterized MAPEG superfamily protein
MYYRACDECIPIPACDRFANRHHTESEEERRKAVENVEYLTIVTGVALLQTFVFAIQVGSARVKYGIDAPAITGAPEFERTFRVHQNTLEQLVILIPSMWMFAQFWRPDIAAGLGLVFVIGRQIYRSAYIKDPSSRSMGFSIGAMATVILLLGGIIGAVMGLL